MYAFFPELLSPVGKSPAAVNLCHYQTTASSLSGPPPFFSLHFSASHQWSVLFSGSILDFLPFSFLVTSMPMLRVDEEKRKKEPDQLSAL